MRTARLAVAVALTALTAACGGGDTTDTAQAPAAVGSSSAAAPEASASSSGGTASGGTASGQVLTGTVGEAGNPDAFVLTLTDGSGQKVTTLPAGQYQVKVDDQSAIHNFHLFGPGGVEEETTVPEKASPTWTVDLQAGEYTAVCDPHPVKMKQTFTVT